MLIPALREKKCRLTNSFFSLNSHNKYTKFLNLNKWEEASSSMIFVSSKFSLVTRSSLVKIKVEESW
jgi:hypothetical protein